MLSLDKDEDLAIGAIGAMNLCRIHESSADSWGKAVMACGAARLKKWRILCVEKGESEKKGSESECRAARCVSQSV